MSYTIIFNSKNGLNQIVGDPSMVMITLANSVEFPFVYWDRMLPEGKYKLTWTYTGSGNMLQGKRYPKVRLEGFRIDNTFETTLNNGAQSNIDLGILKERVFFDSDNNTNTNVGFLTAGLDDNEPIILEKRPENGSLVIKILNEDNTLWYDDTGRITSGGIMSKGSPSFTTMSVRDIPNNTRLIIGTKLIRESNQVDFAKITDFGTGFGAPSGGGTNFTYSCTATGIATGGLTIGLNPSNPPAHYILQLNFEKII